ncbi:30S ribosomal protein S7 [Flavilitoribacter nigricans]|uniref:Small ribosomal subunit protein uS7 n=1 Tax=Flavilitoribacter nigricans (strain ATCC 23147 / DSM 23189 / NBRC 102662 / NCIMB 1420 / SS-2) TaxID=1122177 RepID=A0A2D0N7M9_FLAN2|nr:30S ribosomal protein S7 [Flavilitoribacter nigricans]PHN04521.1 30S ribosomal protein S7 [Flavilitoribacter nigricans DSM 23189 = NBRC 102662]
MRKRKPKLRVIAPDPRYGDPIVTQFVNNMMWEGKKSTAFRIFYDAMDIIKERTKQDEHGIWKKALNNAMPQVEVRSRRIGGATFQIPTEIRAKRKMSIGMKWLIRFSRARSGKGMAEKLAAELIAASKGEGAAVKRKEDTHKMAESNRAFAHFRV